MKPYHLPDALLEPREKPDPKALLEAATAAVRTAQALGFIERMEICHDVRLAQWPGQHWSGRKRTGNKTKRVRPWDDASDARVRLAEETVVENVKIMKAAFKIADLTVATRRGNPDEARNDKADVWADVADYYMDAMGPERHHELELLANIREEFGHGVLYVGWKEERRMERKTMTAAALMDHAMQAAVQQAEEAAAAGQEPPTPEQLAEMVGQSLQAMMDDPEQRTRLAAYLQTVDAAMPQDEALRIARALNGGTGEPIEYFAPYVHASRPCWKAHTPFVSVFYPPETESLERAPWVATVEWLTASQIRDKEATEGWDKAWIEQVLANTNNQLNTFLNAAGVTSHTWLLSGLSIGLGATPSDATGGQNTTWPVFTFWHVATAKGGIPCVYRTVMHANVADSYALHEACPYAHGRLPFVESRRERHRPLLLASRGIPELDLTEQLELKIQRDGAADRTELAVNPPLRVPMQQAGGKVTVAPGVQIPVPRTGTPGILDWFKPPPFDAGTVQLMQQVKTQHDAYHGRGEATLPEIRLLYRQDLGDGWLLDVAAAMRMSFQLVQEFTDELRVSSIAGRPVQLDVTRDDLQGDIDMSLTFDAAQLDRELVKGALDAISKFVAPLDTDGVLDRAALVRLAMRMLNPKWAALVVRPSDQVAQEEVDDEDAALAKMAAGIEPPFKLGRNHQLRLQRLQENLGKNPELQQAMDSRPIFRQLVEARMAMHQQQLDQETNKLIGRTGAKEVLG